jgi:Na+-driven multidrug efflux pump
VETFLPDYAAGIRAARIVLVGLAFLPLAGGFGNYLNTVGRQVIYLTIISAAILLNLILDILFVKNGMGINGVAMGAAITYFVYSLVLITAGLWDIRR